MSTENKEPKRGLKLTGVGGGAGLVFGWLVGVLIDNPIVFAGGGMLLGIAIGAALDQRKRE